MTDAALARINSVGAVLSRIERERSSPGDIVSVDVKDLGLGVRGRTTPLCATIKARKDHCIRADAEGDKLPPTAESTKSLHSPSVRLRRPVGQEVLGEKLPRKRSRKDRKGLFRGSHLTRDCARRILSIFDREQRSTVGSIKHVHKALFRGLRDSVDVFAIPL